MKTKTTITVETYKLSAIRLKPVRAATICPCSGREITTSDPLANCIYPNEIASEIDTQRIKSNNESGD